MREPPPARRRGCRAMTNCVWMLAIAALAGADEPLTRVTFPGESMGTARRLADAGQLAADSRWAEALGEYQRILDEAGDDLVALSPSRCVQARQVCRQRFVALPSAALRVYRDKVDGRARRWLEQGETERDPRWLVKVVDEAFCSTPAERALDLLGDWAFERGDFDAAQRWWRLLVPPLMEAAGASDKPLSYPEPTADRARIRAKQLLARWFRGDTRAREAALAAFRTAHPDAEGSLGGKKGRYADILRELAVDAPPPHASSWTTFGGAAARTEITGGPPPLLLQPTWSRRLDRREETGPAQGQRNPPLTPRDQERRLAFHPVIAGDQVLVANARSVTAYDLRTGDWSVWYDLVRENKLREDDLPKGLLPDASYTLTAAGDHVYVRLGAQQLGPPKENLRTADSYLVCLRRTPDSRGRRECWTHKTEGGGAVAECFEGSPVVHEGRVYIALSRLEATAAVTTVVCYDADSGLPVWSKPVELCEVRDFKPREPRVRHHLLTLAGANLIYCTHSGAIVALETATGRRPWAVRYSSRGDKLSDASPSPRDLAPCVYSSGRVYVAPADYDRILCLEADSGRQLWESAPLEQTAHLVGIAHERLIVTTTGNIQALDCATGRAVRDWQQPGTGDRLPPCGRGLLAADLVLWPTAAGLRALQQSTGQPAPGMACNYTPNEIRGNLALADGCLAVADATHLHVYLAPRLLLEERRRQASLQPNSSAARFELALAEADAGDRMAALQDFTQLAQAAGADQRWQGLALRQLALSQSHALLCSLAETAREQRHLERAAELLTQAAADRFTTQQRLEALQRQADLWAAANRPEQALNTWQQILDDARLRPCAWDDDGKGSARAAGIVAVERIKQLLKIHGPGLCDPIERRARTLLANAGKSGSPDSILQFAQRFPLARASTAALSELAVAQADRPGIAAQAYRLLLQTLDDPAARANAHAGLARAYSRQRCCDRPSPVSALVPPLVRSWQAPLRSANSGDPGSRDAYLLAPADEAAVAGLQRFFCIEDNDSRPTLACREAGDGRPCWLRSLGFAPSWFHRHGDILLLAGERAACGIRLEDGVPLWEFSIASTAGATPWGSAETCGRRFAGWQLAGGRLFCLDAQRRLLAWNTEDGQLLWQAWAPGSQLNMPEPGGTFRPHFLANHIWLLVQTSGGRCLVYDSRTGQRRHELDTSEQPWPRPPLWLDENQVGVQADLCRLVSVDLRTGRETWSRRLPQPSTTMTAAQLAAGGKILLALIDGWQIECLDPRTGKPRWMTAEPRWASAAANEPWQPTVDGHAAFFVRSNVLYAFGLEDGKLLWEYPLNERAAAWRTMLTEGHVLALPLHRHAPRLPWKNIGPLPQRHWENAGSGFPILICDKKDGQLVQRLNFPVGIAEAAVQRLEHAALVATDCSVWRLESDPRR